MKLHYYKCTNPENLPPYEEYDFAKGLAGYRRKLSVAAVTVHKLKYLGKGEVEDIYTPPKKTGNGRAIKAYYDYQH